MQTELRTAVYNLALTAASISAGNLWILAADSNAQLPHVVMATMVSTPNRDTAKQYMQSIIQFESRSLVSQDEAEVLSNELSAIFYNAKTAMDALLSNWRTVSIMEITNSDAFFDDLKWKSILQIAFEWEPI